MQFLSSTFKALATEFGFHLCPTTSYHPAANGLVERSHRQLKAAIMAHANSNWVETLPIILGIRSALKEDLGATSAELVYGGPLRLPGEFIAPTNSALESADPSELLCRLRANISRLRPTPASRYSEPDSFVFKDLKDCSHVFL